jgi:4-aminobutyrate aminotransferase-like enzyme
MRKEMPMDASIAEEALVDRRRRLLGPGLRQFYDFPFHPVRGEGVWLYDAGDKRYLDAYNNVPHVGHCHPHVVAAIAQQAQTLNSNTRYLDEVILDYAERLLQTLPVGFGNCIFVCTGTEANDLAWRLAKAYTGGSGAIASQHAYHGNSTTVSALQGSASARNGPDWVARVPSPGLIAARHAPDYVGGAADFAAQFEAATDALAAAGHKPCAAYFDTVFCSDGLHVPVPGGFMNPAVDRWRERGGLLVADEVLAGFGRVGTHMWGFEALGITPDIVTMGKPAGNGHPIGVVATRPEIVEAFFSQDRYFNTFGGNPVSCAAGIAVLEVLAREHLQDNARAVGAYLKEGLAGLSAGHELIGGVRGAGLFVGVDLVDDRRSGRPAVRQAAKVMNEMARLGVLVGLSGPHKAMLKIRPPMVFSRENADQLVETLDRVLASL